MYKCFVVADNVGMSELFTDDVELRDDLADPFLLLLAAFPQVSVQGVDLNRTKI